MLEAAMTKFADKPAFRSFGQTLSYADMDRQSAAFAAWLQHKLGVKKPGPSTGVTAGSKAMPSAATCPGGRPAR